jgi:hypothetical protein
VEVYAHPPYVFIEKYLSSGTTLVTYAIILNSVKVLGIYLYAYIGIDLYIMAKGGQVTKFELSGSCSMHERD